MPGVLFIRRSSSSRQALYLPGGLLKPLGYTVAMANDIEATLLLLAREKVRFLVVGGVAVVLHGYLRLTADLDIVLALDAENVARAVAMLEREGFEPRAPVALQEFRDSETRARWAGEENMQVFSL